MQLLADMGMSPVIAEAMRADGHDVVHVYDIGWYKAQDHEILQLARTESRIVLTFDLDFGAPLAESNQSSPSVIIFRLENGSPSFVIERLRKALVHGAAELSHGALIIVEDRRIRIRPLPLRNVTDL